jgi:hypothetical protein
LRSTTKKFEEFREAVARLERLVNQGTTLPRRRGRGQVLPARRLRPRVSETTGEHAASQEPDDPSEGRSTDRAPIDGHHRVIEVSEGISLEFKEELGVFWLQTNYEQHFCRRLDKKRENTLMINAVERNKKEQRLTRERGIRRAPSRSRGHYIAMAIGPRKCMTAAPHSDPASTQSIGSRPRSSSQ